MRLIDADAVKESIKKQIDMLRLIGNDELMQYADVIQRGFIQEIDNAPTAQPELSRIEQELHGKSPEEQYEFLYWLLLKFGLTYTDSRLAVIEWLRGEQDG